MSWFGWVMVTFWTLNLTLNVIVEKDSTKRTLQVVYSAAFLVGTLFVGTGSLNG